MAKLIQEHFNSISEMLSVICSRPNNEIMKNEHSSTEIDPDFYGTRTWDDAVELFQYGYTEILEEIKKGSTQLTGTRAPVQRKKIVNDVIGYAPHVPNAILGLPNSMIGMKKAPQKIKTVSIVYKMTANYCEHKDTFKKAGIALISAINMLELSGIRVSLKLCFECAKKDSDYTFATVKIKDYCEHLDIQKLCFPLANVAMFRRFGFKWLETCEGLTSTGWRMGYGRSLQEKKEIPELIEKEIKENEYFIFLQEIKEWNFDPRKILEQIKK